MIFDQAKKRTEIINGYAILPGNITIYAEIEREERCKKCLEPLKAQIFYSINNDFAGK